MKYCLYLVLALVCVSCSQQEDKPFASERVYRTVRAVARHSGEQRFRPKEPQWRGRPVYSWEKRFAGKYSQITKEFFRCRGSEINPIRPIHQEGRQPVYCRDCGGGEKHSLPLREGKEFVFPVLIELLNFIQNETDSQVVVTSGHRCPLHNSYVDASAENRASKHQICAAVTFYVQGFEEQPKEIIQVIQNYYRDHPKWGSHTSFNQFSTYGKKIDVTTPAIMNKEILVKMYKTNEGRNFDNRHPYPYLQIQVRWDRETQKSVNYTWHGAHRNYLRW